MSTNLHLLQRTDAALVMSGLQLSFSVVFLHGSHDVRLSFEMEEA